MSERQSRLPVDFSVHANSAGLYESWASVVGEAVEQVSNNENNPILIHVAALQRLSHSRIPTTTGKPQEDSHEPAT